MFKRNLPPGINSLSLPTMWTESEINQSAHRHQEEDHEKFNQAFIYRCTHHVQRNSGELRR